MLLLSWYRYSPGQVKGAGSIFTSQPQVSLPFNVFIRNIATQARPPSRSRLATLPSHALNRLIETLVPEGLVLVGRQSQLADHFFVEMIPE